MIVTVNKTPTTIFCLFLVCSAFLCSASDTIKWNSFISDLKNETLVSIGSIFELGFFTPNEASNSNNRYVGIWYHNMNPRTVVWVANREKPVKVPNGAFGIAVDGTLIVSDASGVIYWSIPGKLSSKSLAVKLLDSGNLVFSDDDQPAISLWESFEDPTDTFLPGMKMNANLSLTSWRRDGDPGTGRFKFNLSQEGGNSYVISTEPLPFGKDRVPGKSDWIDDMPSAIPYFLSNFTGSLKPGGFNPQLNVLRLVMNYTGRLECMIWDVNHWGLIWWGPGNCSTPNLCGSFGSCNNNNRIPCKCLPGFKPSNSEKWNSGEFSGGCTRISTCRETDTFFTLRMMKMSDPNDISPVENETDCRDRCLKSCQCQAYSYVAATSQQVYDTSNFSCLIWSEVVNDLREEYKNSSLNLSVRVAKSDIEPTVRSCEPCGTNMIPYPLSTGTNCGEPMYFSFLCNTSNGQVRFSTPGGSYRVPRIDPNARKFVITVGYEGNYRKSTENLQLNRSGPFVISRSTVYSANPITQDEDIEIMWEPLQEPICNSSKDCNDWSNSICKAAGDGKRRCLCTTGFQWNGTTGSCTKEDAETSLEPLPEPNCNSSKDCNNWTNSICEAARDGKKRCLCNTGFQWNRTTGSCTKESEASNRKTSLTLIITTPLAIMFFLVCVIACIYVWRRKMTERQEASEKRSRALRTLDSERHLKDLLDSDAFKEDEQGIDIPFFDFESILAATNSFSDTNKLGQGGYGPVYKGIFPGGQEIAVKRLSSVSRQGLQEFKNEVVLIAKLQHKNLVRLRGYCIKGEEKILLYEYMQNKSLDLFLFDQSLSKILEWQMRINIILGIARGLVYLHHDSRLKIIHRDLKTSNILLDEEMNPKISDFGLARIVGGKEIGANTTRVVGTYGYMSPEYALDGHFSIKSDVFSFGVILLEIISGKNNTGFYQSELALSLIGYAWKLWTESKVLDLMDPALHEDCNADQFVKCVNIGLLCVQENPGDRPTISNVVIMLESETATVPTPKQPAFVPRVDFSSAASSSSRPETNTEFSSTFGGK